MKKTLAGKISGAGAQEVPALFPKKPVKGGKVIEKKDIKR